jgi:hypothetical protein
MPARPTDVPPTPPTPWDHESNTGFQDSGATSSGAGDAHAILTDPRYLAFPGNPNPPSSSANPWALSTTTREPQQLQINGSVKGTVVPILTGKCRVTGLHYARPMKLNGTWSFAYLFGTGPCATVAAADVKINGYSPSTAPSVYSWGVYRGLPEGTVDTAVQNVLGFPVGAAHPWMIWGFIKAYSSGLWELGIPNVTVDLKLQAWDAFSSTPGWVESENPVLGLYTYLTKNPLGPLVDPALIHLPSWESAADWCATLVESKERWRGGGAIQTQSIPDVVRTFLRSAWCAMPWVAGQWRLAPRQDDPDPVVIQAERLRRRRVGLSARPTVARSQFRNREQEYEEDSRWAQDPAYVNGTAPWVLRQDSPPLLNAADVASRDVAMMLAAGQEETVRITATVDPAECPAVLDVTPGQQVVLITDRWSTGRLCRVESVAPDDTHYQLSLFATNATVPVVGGVGDPYVEPPVPEPFPPEVYYDRSLSTADDDLDVYDQDLLEFSWGGKTGPGGLQPLSDLDGYVFVIEYQFTVDGPWVPWGSKPAEEARLSLGYPGADFGYPTAAPVAYRVGLRRSNGTGFVEGYLSADYSGDSVIPAGEFAGYGVQAQDSFGADYFAATLTWTPWSGFEAYPMEIWIEIDGTWTGWVETTNGAGEAWIGARPPGADPQPIAPHPPGFGTGQTDYHNKVRMYLKLEADGARREWTNGGGWSLIGGPGMTPTTGMVPKHDGTSFVPMLLGGMADEDDAPSDGSTYGRKDGSWESVSGVRFQQIPYTGSTEWIPLGGEIPYNDAGTYRIRLYQGHFNLNNKTYDEYTIGFRTLNQNTAPCVFWRRHGFTSLTARIGLLIEQSTTSPYNYRMWIKAGVTTGGAVQAWNEPASGGGGIQELALGTPELSIPTWGTLWLDTSDVVTYQPSSHEDPVTPFHKVMFGEWEFMRIGVAPILRCNSAQTARLRAASGQPLQLEADAGNKFLAILSDGRLYLNGVALTDATTNQIVEGAIKSGAVTADKIGSGAVTEGKIGIGAVTATKLGTSAVTTTKIGGNAVTSDKTSGFSGVIQVPRFGSTNRWNITLTNGLVTGVTETVI